MSAAAAGGGDIKTSAEGNTNSTGTPPSSSAVISPGHQLPDSATSSRHWELDRPFFQMFENQRPFQHWNGGTTRYLVCEVSEIVGPGPMSSVHEIRLGHAEKRAEAFEEVTTVLTNGRWRQEFEGLKREVEGMWTFFWGRGI